MLRQLLRGLLNLRGLDLMDTGSMTIMKLHRIKLHLLVLTRVSDRR